MGKLFNLDGSFMGFLGRVADLLILNLIFVVTCIPIVTIGPALTALYSVTLKMVKNEDSYIFKSYFKAFKESFKISILAWLIILVALIIFVVDYRIMATSANGLSEVLTTIFLVLMIICFVVGLYLFPYIARFEGGLKASFKNATLIMLASAPWTFLLTIITGGVVAVSIFFIPLQYVLPLWILFGFAALAYVQSFIFRRVFVRYEPEKEIREEVEQDKIEH